MNSYYIRNEDETVQGPYAPEEVLGWIEEGRLDDRTQYSTDTITWRYARDLAELGGTTAAVVSERGFPEPSLLIRQGASIQGPYGMSRIRRYVKQRRIQHYMLFSEDGVFWLGPEHVPGLLPDGYVPLAPPQRPTEVPADGEAPAEARMPRQAKPPGPGDDVGSETLVGIHLDEGETQNLGPPPPPPVQQPIAAGALEEENIEAAPLPVTYYVRINGSDVYGPCTEEALHSWVDEGRVDISAEFSNDGRRWTPGRNMVSLFGPPPAEMPNQPAHAPRRRLRRR